VTLDAGVVVQGTDNLVWAVMGFLQQSGGVDLAGQGVPGSTQLTSPGGAVGSTQAGGGLLITRHSISSYKPVRSVKMPVVQGGMNGLPYFVIDNNGTTIAGLPSDLRGSPGARGGPLTANRVPFGGSNTVTSGGVGGNGGGSFYTISRGIDVAPTGYTDTSGFPGQPGGTDNDFTSYTQRNAKTVSAGGGGGGSPGGRLALIDGAGNLSTGLIAGSVMDQGDSPIFGTPATKIDYGLMQIKSVERLMPDSSYFTGYPKESRKQSLLRIQKIVANESLTHQAQPGRRCRCLRSPSTTHHNLSVGTSPRST